MTANRECPICRNKNDIMLLCKQNFLIPNDYEGLPDEYNIVECNICGFVYDDMVASQNIFDNYYARNARYENMSLYSSASEIKKSGLLRFEDGINEFKSFINTNSRILDMGCANGGFLYVLKSHGYHNIVGLDLSEKCVSNVKDLGIDCYNGGCFSIPDNFSKKFNNNFDLIILSHVIEHIYDVNLAMNTLGKLLNEKGMLYIEVPDASKYYDFYLELNLNPLHFFDLEHINHFNKETLTNLGKKFGFKVINSSEKVALGYPNISMILKKETDDSGAKLIRYDDKNLKKYVSKSNEDDAKVKKRLSELVASQEKIILWGIGAFTLSLFKKGLNDCNVVAIVDSDKKKHGININGIKVEDPEIIKNYEATIVILPVRFQNEINQQINEMGTKNKVKSIY